MRLHIFIQENMEPILQQWENFAREVWPDETEGEGFCDLRDHAKDMLNSIIHDLQTPQSEGEQHDKSVGDGNASASSEKVDSASASHAAQRLEAGFDINALLGEFRALRASVVNLWDQAVPQMQERHIQDMTRFNECIDQLQAESVRVYSQSVEHSREIFLGILGHDLKTPLSAVTMMAGLLEENKDLSDTYREMVSLIGVGSREMKLLVDDLLDFAGTQLGVKMHITRQSMNMEELCHEVIEEIRAAHPECVIDLNCNGDGNGEWDRPRLRQLISNLLSNSVQHGCAKAPIRLFMKTDRDVVELQVCNQGPPIPHAMQAAIFDPLYSNACNGSHRVVGGIGLGLYIAREVAKAHDGTIEVNSDDRETAFIVKLPLWASNGTAGDEVTSAKSESTAGCH